MAILGFTPQTQTVAIVTSGTASTATTTTVNFPGSGGGAMGPFNQPQIARVVNAGATTVFISFTPGSRTAVIPTAGTNQLEFPVLPNTMEKFNVPVGNTSVNINTISTGTSIPIYVTFGEGV